MTGRVRLIGLVITPQIVIDDGEHLEARQVGSLTVPPTRIDDLPVIIREALGGLQTQLDTTP